MKIGSKGYQRYAGKRVHHPFQYVKLHNGIRLQAQIINEKIGIGVIKKFQSSREQLKIPFRKKKKNIKEIRKYFEKHVLRHINVADKESFKQEIFQKIRALTKDLGIKISYLSKSEVHALVYRAINEVFERDPFQEVKREVNKKALLNLPSLVTDLRRLSEIERLKKLIRLAVISNIGDLAFGGDKLEKGKHFRIDNSRLLLSLLKSSQCVGYFLDNCGDELLVDLLIIHQLLEQGKEVVVFVKSNSFQVGDVTKDDFLNMILDYTEGIGRGKKIFREGLGDYWVSKKLKIFSSEFLTTGINFFDEAAKGFLRDIVDLRLDLAVLKGEYLYTKVFLGKEFPPAWLKGKEFPREWKGRFPLPIIAFLRTVKYPGTTMDGWPWKPIKDVSTGDLIVQVEHLRA